MNQNFAKDLKAIWEAVYSFVFLLGISYSFWLIGLVVYLFHYERDVLEAWKFHYFLLFLLMVVDSIIVIGLARRRGLRLFCSVSMACLAVYMVTHPLPVEASSRVRDRLEVAKFYRFDDRLYGFLFTSVLLNLGYSFDVLNERVRQKRGKGKGNPEATEDR